MSSPAPDRAPSPGRDPSPERGPSPDRGPVLPDRSREDTDAAWGEYPESDDDDRLYRDRPPHWDDF